MTAAHQREAYWLAATTKGEPVTLVFNPSGEKAEILTADELPGPPLTRDLPYTGKAKLDQNAETGEAAR